MFTFSSRHLSRAAVVAGLVLAGAGTFFTAGVEPALALCKYGTPHCIDLHRPNLPSVGGEKLPGSGWVDPDCGYYGNCDSSELKGTEIRRRQSGPVYRLPVAQGMAKR
jgi:hypothetical protein